MSEKQDMADMEQELANVLDKHKMTTASKVGVLEVLKYILLNAAQPVEVNTTKQTGALESNLQLIEGKNND